MRVDKVAACYALLAPLLLVAGEKSDRAAAKQRIDVLNFVRILNTAELNYLHSNGHYALYTELIKSGNLEDAVKASTKNLRTLDSLNLQSISDPLPGFRFRFAVNADGLGYELSLTDSKAECGESLFSNESGAVYEGKTLECEASAADSATLVKWAPPDVDETVPAVRTDLTCPLPTILQESSRRVQEFVSNLQQFSAQELIEHTEVRKNGNLRIATKGTFNYVA